MTSPVDRRLAAILAADVVGYSRLMEANEERTMAALKHHRREFFDPTIVKHGGRIFKVMGDGFLVEFGSVLNAARCAVEIQRGMPMRNAGVPEDRHIKFRIGINVGDLIVEGDDFYGDGVNIAARLEGLAPPGGICCSAAVRSQIGNRLDMDFLDQGEKSVKNIAQPLHVYFLDLAEVGPKSGAGPVTGKPSIAVLPFSNMSNDPEQEYFSDGITEDIITDLSNVSGLFVLGRNTVFAYKGRSVNLMQTARELGVSFLLEGSVRKAGQKVRINAQLIEGSTGGHAWAARYDRDLTDIFAVQDEITQTIVAQLRVKLLPEEREAITRAPTSNVEAYACYLRGREFFRKVTRPNLVRARQMFERAATIDPLYAAAFAGIADCDSFLLWHYAEDVPAASILSNAATALALNPSLAEAHASLGLAHFLCQNYEAAEKSLKSAIARNPNLFEASYFSALVCYTLKKFEEAVVHYERAAEISPDDFEALSLSQQAYRSLGLRDQERDAARRALARATRAVSQSAANPRPLYHAASALVTLGRQTEAREMMAKAIALDPEDFLTRYNVACLYSLLGDIDRALDMLIEILPRSPPATKAWALHEADFFPLHGHPRWSEVEKVAG